MEKSNYWKIRPEAAAKFVQDLKHELNSDHSCWEDLGENYKELYIEVFEKALPVLFGWNVPSVIPEVRELYEIGKQAYWDRAEKGGSDVEFEEARAAAIRDRILSCFPPVPLSLNAEGLAVRMCEIPDGGGNLPKPWRSRPRYEQEFLLRAAAFVRDRTLLAATNSGVNDNDPETFQDCERLIKQWDTVNVEAFLDAAQNKQTGAFNVQRLLYLIDVLADNRKPKTLPDREKIAKILRVAPGEWVDALDKTWDRVKDMYFDQTDAVLAYLEPWLRDPAGPSELDVTAEELRNVDRRWLESRNGGPALHIEQMQNLLDFCRSRIRVKYECEGCKNLETAHEQAEEELRKLKKATQQNDSFDRDEIEALARVLCRADACDELGEDSWDPTCLSACEAYRREARAAIAHMRKRPEGLPTRDQLKAAYREYYESFGGMSGALCATDFALQYLVPYLRDPVGWELDVSPIAMLKAFRSAPRGELHKNIDDVESMKAVLDLCRSRIRPVFECKECAYKQTRIHRLEGWVGALEGYCDDMRKLAAQLPARAALEGEE